jgi:hypothetical protein
MKAMFSISLAVGAVLLGTLSPEPLSAQACKDEQAMVDEYKQGIVATVETVKKETLDSFEKAFHQKTCLTKLTLSLNMMDEVISCFDKASQDAAATKEEAASYKAQKETYAKLKDRLAQYKSQLKGVEGPKDAKALIEKFELTK